jgi:hypothetical protein
MRLFVVIAFPDDAAGEYAGLRISIRTYFGMCGVGDLPCRAWLTGRRGLVRISDASGRRHRPPVAAWYR